MADSKSMTNCSMIIIAKNVVLCSAINTHKLVPKTAQLTHPQKKWTAEAIETKG
jgi:hypothetical protein